MHENAPALASVLVRHLRPYSLLLSSIDSTFGANRVVGGGEGNGVLPAPSHYHNLPLALTARGSWIVTGSPYGFLNGVSLARSL